MNIRKYAAFVRAVELGSLSKAAEELGYTQSGISHMMQSLEDEVGFPLMVRTSTGILPNREGELLLPVIRQLLNTSETLEQYIAKVKGADTGHIRIAAYASVETYWLPKIIREFQKDYPHVEIEITEGGSNTIETIMANREADLCIYAGGEGKDFIIPAVLAGADCLVTGDAGYNACEAAAEGGFVIIEAGHYHTEFPVCESLARFIRDLGLECEIYDACPSRIL